jgi:hypothetical protein
MKVIVTILFASLLFSCNNSSTEQSKKDSTAPALPDTAKKTTDVDTATTVYCYIAGIEEKKDSIIINVDDVEYFNGPNVVEEAKKRHRADTSYGKDGKMDVFVPDDYFIVNDDKRIRKLYMPATTPIHMDSEIAGKEAKNIDSYAYFSKHYKNSLFMLTVKDDRIMSLKEVFLP